MIHERYCFETLFYIVYSGRPSYVLATDWRGLPAMLFLYLGEDGDQACDYYV